MNYIIEFLHWGHHYVITAIYWDLSFIALLISSFVNLDSVGNEYRNSNYPTHIFVGILLSFIPVAHCVLIILTLGNVKTKDLYPWTNQAVYFLPLLCLLGVFFL